MTTQQSFCSRVVRALTLVVAVGFVQACATNTVSSVDNAEVQAEPDPALGSVAAEPELTLNLPNVDDCLCPPQADRDFTFLEKGLRALAAGDYTEANNYFQRYQRIESSAEAQWEAAVAIAYSSLLPNNPAYDPRAASSAFADLKRQPPVHTAVVHEQVLMMRDALEIITSLQRRIDTLQSEKSALASDLARLEEALRRLRELALGQKAAKP